MFRRGAKRKLISQSEGVGSRRPKSDLVMPKLPANGYPTEHPFNKDGFRYILAEPDPHAPFRQEFDESQDWVGKPIPGFLYRKFCSNFVLIAMHDRAPQLKVSEDRLSVVGEKGYCLARATHGVHFGTWYYEINIVDMPDGSHCRLGWSQEYGNLQGPCGYDKFSYSWRSRKGTKFHESIGTHFANQGYGCGDTIGLLIHLPENDDSGGVNHPYYLPTTHKDRPLVKFKNYLYFEEEDDVAAISRSLKPLKGSYIDFYKNGTKIGTSFTDINAGVYYPAASFYKSITLNFNFGPNLKYPPTDVNYQCVSSLAEESAVRQTVCDLLYFAENDGKLSLDNFYFRTSST